MIIFIMDYEQLYQVLPKASMTWSVSDIEVWLRFIGLQQLYPQFKNASVDGSCLSSLTEQDFKAELGIESRIIVKKIMVWTNQGIQNYDNFLREKQMQTFSQERSKEKLKLTSIIERRQKIPFKKKSFIPNPKRQQTESESKIPREINELIIKQCEGPIPVCHSLKEHGAMLGRHSKTEIHILEESVSRFHAQIEYESEEYYLRDFGSSTGTFIRIHEKYPLRDGTIIEMGSNQFQVEMDPKGMIYLKIMEGTKLRQPFILPRKKKVNIGRKPTNEINFPEDQHLSNIHAIIFQIDGIWFIEDVGTTNGTWIRLSPEGVTSQRYIIEDQMQFKLGTTLTYECQKSSCTSRKTMKEKSDRCLLCKVAERNCILMPCRHNVCCFKCVEANEMNQCMSCKSTVDDVIKIFKV